MGCCYNRRQSFAVWEAKGDEKKMYVLLYLLWILLNGRVTAEILTLGVPVAGLVYGFGYLALDCRLSKDLLLLKRLGHVLVFLAMVVWEVVKANVAIIRIVLSPHMEITPCLVPVKTDLKSAGARAALANAITLTPGTITVDVKDDVLWVHALTAEMAEGMFTGVLILSVVILSINMVFCLLRAVLGPRFSDRLIAINMIGTKTVLMIALLIKVFHEDYLVDICLIYALISFLSFVVLTKLLGLRMSREEGMGGSGTAEKENEEKEALL